MYKKILVPVDGSATSQGGLLEAIKLAKNQGAQLRLFYMVSDRVVDCGYGSSTLGGDLIASARAGGLTILSDAEALTRREGLEPETLMVESLDGSAAASIVAQAKSWPADLIVMGTHGRKGLIRMALGSDAERVARDAPVPVLLVRDIVSPITDTVVQRDRVTAAAKIVYA
jgi:nucleotide-binding universal stress UspA family protein